ncbi:MAG: hypothetical protein Kow0074_08550 [Candidatus Zixiibacteriota bacterium]
MTDNNPTELDEHGRAELLERYRRLKAEYAKGRSSKPRKTLEELEPLAQQANEVQETYFARLPRVTLSRCPHCNEPLIRSFDPWGPDGLWWEHSHRIEHEQPASCRHFVVLTGAVDLNGNKPPNVPGEIILGADKPFVIPAILSRKGMIAVIARVEMLNGFLAYPIAYFAADGPLDSTLTQPWTVKTMDTPGGGWRMDTSEWDFDLMPWVEREKLKWIDPGSEDMAISTTPPRGFPFANTPGEGRMLILQDGDVLKKAPPDGEPIEPFE